MAYGRKSGGKRRASIPYLAAGSFDRPAVDGAALVLVGAGRNCRCKLGSCGPDKLGSPWRELAVFDLENIGVAHAADLGIGCQCQRGRREEERGCNDQTEKASHGSGEAGISIAL